MLFFLLINVKMPTIVGILTFMRGKFSCSAEMSLDFFITLGPDLLWHLKKKKVPKYCRIGYRPPNFVTSCQEFVTRMPLIGLVNCNTTSTFIRKNTVYCHNGSVIG